MSTRTCAWLALVALGARGKFGHEQCTLARTLAVCLENECHWRGSITDGFCAPDSEPCTSAPDSEPCTPAPGALGVNPDLGPNQLIRWEWTPSAADRADESYAFGHAMGTRFEEQIKARLAGNDFLMTTLLKTFASPDAPHFQVYSDFLDANNATYPQYVRELEGIADGSGTAFELLFLSQLMEEFTYFVRSDDDEHAAVDRNPERCSDLLYATSDGSNVYLAHNEDSDATDLNHTALISVPKGVAGGAPFTAFTYLGNTPTGAFGWNAIGVLFTMNYVAPPAADPRGLGRVFMARSLLEMESLDDGVQRITAGQGGRFIAAGHNYQIFDFVAKRLVNVEVAAFGVSSVRETLAGAPAYFHANTYQTLDLPGQHLSNSSLHRDARAKVLLAESPIRDDDAEQGMLAVLGDQGDRQWPIYHDNKSHERGELSDWTMGSIFVDADALTVKMWTTNPHDTEPVAIIKLPTPTVFV